MIVDYAPRFVETEEEKKLDRSVPLWQPMSPFPIQTDLPPAPKAPNPAFARFSKLLPDVPKIAHSIIQDNFDYTQALVVEASVDQLVDWAPNVLTFVADHRFLGMRPFARQAEMLIRLFEEWCPRCSSKDWFKEGFPVGATLEQIQTNVAMMDEGVCPHCGFTKAEGRIQGMFADPEELVAVIGQRGGKSAVSSMGISYLTHLNCKLHTPWKTYGLTPGQVVEFTMVATTVGQSEKALWSNFKKMLENSYWFKQYKAVCDEFGHKHGVRETIAANETFIKFKHKGVELYNASNDNKALRGSTRFGFAIDELAFFDEGVTAKTRSNGSETYTSLNNSLMTLRQRAVDLAVQDKGSLVPNPMGFCISSPRAMNDTMMQLFRDRKSDPKAVAMHLPTWKMNPTLPFKSPAMQKMLRQPNGWRDFGAQPPLTDNPLITRTGIVQEAFSTPLSVGATYGRIISPAATATQDDFQVASGRRMSNYVVANLDKDYKPPAIQKVSEEALAALGPYREVYEELLARPLSNRPHALGIDIGSTKCAMAICGLCLVGDRVVVDFLVEIKPTPQAAINLPYVFDELMIPLIEKLNVVGVFYDQWNSLHQIQKLTNLKGVLGPQNAPSEVRKWRAELKREESLPDFVAERVNLTVADANLLVSRLEQGDILFPAMERPLLDLVQDSSLVPEHTPYTHLALQMSTVRAVGNRLYKPSGGGDDDLFRAWAHVAIKAFTDDVVISLLKGETRKKSGNHNQNSAPLGYVSVGASGRGVKVIPVGAGGSPFAVVRRSGGGAGVKR
jgi:hypothetical protein